MFLITQAFMIHIRDKEHEGKAMQIINDYDAESKRLDVNREGIQDAVMVNLIDRFEHWGTIRSLSLTENDISQIGLRGLIAKPMRSLIELYLGNNLISNDAVCILVKIDIPNLKALQLERNFIGNDGTRNISKGKWPALTSLKLSDNNISSNGVDNLTLGNWNNLTYLYLERNKFVLASLLQVLAACEWGKLKRLVLYSNDTMNYLTQNRVRQQNCNWAKIMIYILPTKWQIQI